MEASDVKNASTHASADDVQLPESVSAAVQYELAEADRTVQETLAEVWSRWCSPPISLANHTHAELVPAFENYAERILRARAGALMQVIDTVPEYLKTVEQVAIPHTIDLIVPHYSLPDSLLQTRDLGAMRIDCRPDGYWEQWIHSTWNLFKEKEGLTSELDIVVLIQFQWVLRFPANREPWVRRMLAHLSGSIPTLKAQAWKVKLDQSLGRHSVADSRVTERVFQARAIDASVAEQPVKQSMGIEPSGPLAGNRVARRRGFEANVEDHSKFFQATESFGDDWRSHLIEVCAELHRLGALVPERWRKEEFIESWDEIPAMFGRGKSAWKAKVVTYIGYRRAWLMKHNKSLPKVSRKSGDATDPNS